MEVIWRILLVTIITIIGAAITCGGNILLSGGNEDTFPGWFIFWILEIIGIFIYSIYRLFFQGKIPKQTISLMQSLNQIDISDVRSVTFMPKSGTYFVLDSENVKKIAVFITDTRGKTDFEPEELREIYIHVASYIDSRVSQDEFENTREKLEEFVKSGGEVRIEKTNS